MWLLICLNWRMLEQSSFFANFDNKTREQIAKNGKSIRKTNLFSVFVIFTTLIVTIMLLYYFLKGEITITFGNVLYK